MLAIVSCSFSPFSFKPYQFLQYQLKSINPKQELIQLIHIVLKLNTESQYLRNIFAIFGYFVATFMLLKYLVLVFPATTSLHCEMVMSHKRKWLFLSLPLRCLIRQSQDQFSLNQYTPAHQKLL